MAYATHFYRSIHTISLSLHGLCNTLLSVHTYNFPEPAWLMQHTFIGPYIQFPWACMAYATHFYRSIHTISLSLHGLCNTLLSVHTYNFPEPAWLMQHTFIGPYIQFPWACMAYATHFCLSIHTISQSLHGLCNTLLSVHTYNFPEPAWLMQHTFIGPYIQFPWACMAYATHFYRSIHTISLSLHGLCNTLLSVHTYNFPDGLCNTLLSPYIFPWACMAYATHFYRSIHTISLSLHGLCNTLLSVHTYNFPEPAWLMQHTFIGPYIQFPWACMAYATHFYRSIHTISLSLHGLCNFPEPAWLFYHTFIGPYIQFPWACMAYATHFYRSIHTISLSLHGLCNTLLSVHTYNFPEPAWLMQHTFIGPYIQFPWACMAYATHFYRSIHTISLSLHGLCNTLLSVHTYNFPEPAWLMQHTFIGPYIQFPWACMAYATHFYRSIHTISLSLHGLCNTLLSVHTYNFPESLHGLCNTLLSVHTYNFPEPAWLMQHTFIGPYIQFPWACMAYATHFYRSIHTISLSLHGLCNTLLSVHTYNFPEPAWLMQHTFIGPYIQFPWACMAYATHFYRSIHTISLSLHGLCNTLLSVHTYNFPEPAWLMQHTFIGPYIQFPWACMAYATHFYRSIHTISLSLHGLCNTLLSVHTYNFPEPAWLMQHTFIGPYIQFPWACMAYATHFYRSIHTISLSLHGLCNTLLSVHTYNFPEPAWLMQHTFIGPYIQFPWACMAYATHFYRSIHTISLSLHGLCNTLLSVHTYNFPEPAWLMQHTFIEPPYIQFPWACMAYATHFYRSIHTISLSLHGLCNTLLSVHTYNFPEPAWLMQHTFIGPYIQFPWACMAYATHFYRSIHTISLSLHGLCNTLLSVHTYNFPEPAWLMQHTFIGPYIQFPWACMAYATHFYRSIHTISLSLHGLCNTLLSVHTYNFPEPAWLMQHTFIGPYIQFPWACMAYATHFYRSIHTISLSLHGLCNTLLSVHTYNFPEPAWLMQHTFIGPYIQFPWACMAYATHFYRSIHTISLSLHGLCNTLLSVHTYNFPCMAYAAMAYATHFYRSIHTISLSLHGLCNTLLSVHTYNFPEPAWLMQHTFIGPYIQFPWACMAYATHFYRSIHTISLSLHGLCNTLLSVHTYNFPEPAWLMQHTFIGPYIQFPWACMAYATHFYRSIHTISLSLHGLCNTLLSVHAYNFPEPAWLMQHFYRSIHTISLSLHGLCNTLLSVHTYNFPEPAWLMQHTFVCPYIQFPRACMAYATHFYRSMHTISLSLHGLCNTLLYTYNFPEPAWLIHTFIGPYISLSLHGLCNTLLSVHTYNFPEPAWLMQHTFIGPYIQFPWACMAYATHFYRSIHTISLSLHGLCNTLLSVHTYNFPELHGLCNTLLSVHTYNFPEPAWLMQHTFIGPYIQFPWACMAYATHFYRSIHTISLSLHGLCNTLLSVHTYNFPEPAWLMQHTFIGPYIQFPLSLHGLCNTLLSVHTYNFPEPAWLMQHTFIGPYIQFPWACMAYATHFYRSIHTISLSLHGLCNTLLSVHEPAWLMQHTFIGPYIQFPWTCMAYATHFCLSKVCCISHAASGKLYVWTDKSVLHKPCRLRQIVCMDR